MGPGKSKDVSSITYIKDINTWQDSDFFSSEILRIPSKKLFFIYADVLVKFSFSELSSENKSKKRNFGPPKNSIFLKRGRASTMNGRKS
jgi:hypothetical protein